MAIFAKTRIVLFEAWWFWGPLYGAALAVSSGVLADSLANVSNLVANVSKYPTNVSTCEPNVSKSDDATTVPVKQAVFMPDSPLKQAVFMPELLTLASQLPADLADLADSGNTC